MNRLSNCFVFRRALQENDSGDALAQINKGQLYSLNGVIDTVAKGKQKLFDYSV